MRRIIYVPMIHEQENRVSNANELFGLISENVLFVKGDFEEKVNKHWEKVLSEWDKRIFRTRGLKIYSEGFTEESRKYLAYISSPENFEDFRRSFEEQTVGKSIVFDSLILRLIEGGAKFEVTEDKNLLAEGREALSRNILFVSQLLVEVNRFSAEDLDQPMTVDEFDRWTRLKLAVEEGQSRIRTITEKRDEFIAQQINQGLEEGGTAILFLGADHDPARYLQKDIRVVLISEEFRELVETKEAHLFDGLLSKER